MRCVGVLPGLGHYRDSDDSSSDSDSSGIDSPGKCCMKRDLLGRRPDQLEGKKKEDDKS